MGTHRKGSSESYSEGKHWVESAQGTNGTQSKVWGYWRLSGGLGAPAGCGGRQGSEWSLIRLSSATDELCDPGKVALQETRQFAELKNEDNKSQQPLRRL